MRVSIDIISHAGGEEISCSSRGGLFRTEAGFRAEYTLDGDECSISWDGQTLLQVRRGAFNIQIPFCEGRETECLLSEGVRTFGMPVFTEALSAELSDDGCIITIAYLQHGVRTELLFKAEREKTPNGRRLPRQKKN